mmetsp:Transcript_66579/g.192866  ORF Transcript_66579/g.192866 Transcript_66579/m.192866 type:complete len:223 (-) Transcript_66579:478-1146(-)
MQPRSDQRRWRRPNEVRRRHARAPEEGHPGVALARCDDEHGCEGCSVQDRELGDRPPGHVGLLHRRGARRGLQEDHGIPAAGHQAEPRLFRGGHLDHQAEVGELLQELRRPLLHRRRGLGAHGGVRQPRRDAHRPRVPRVLQEWAHRQVRHLDDGRQRQVLGGRQGGRRPARRPALLPAHRRRRVALQFGHGPARRHHPQEAEGGRHLRRRRYRVHLHVLRP